MSVALIGQAFATWSVLQWAIAIIVVCGIVAVVFVITRQLGVTIPPFIVTVAWICLAVVIGVLAVKFIAGVF